MHIPGDIAECLYSVEDFEREQDALTESGAADESQTEASKKHGFREGDGSECPWAVQVTLLLRFMALAFAIYGRVDSVPLAPARRSPPRFSVRRSRPCLHCLTNGVREIGVRGRCPGFFPQRESLQSSNCKKTHSEHEQRSGLRGRLRDCQFAQGRGR